MLSIQEVMVKKQCIQHLSTDVSKTNLTKGLFFIFRAWSVKVYVSDIYMNI